MITSAAWLATLAVFSGLSMNIIFQFGFGLKGIALERNTDGRELLAGSGITFVSIILLWLFFSFVRSVLFLGLLEYLLIFPVTIVVFSILEYVMNHFILLEPVTLGDIFSGGASGAALFMTLNVAGNFLDAVVLAVGFILGIVAAGVIVAEIRRRSEIEAVPRWLRGAPLAVIAMGLLALIFSSCAVMLFRVLGAH